MRSRDTLCSAAAAVAVILVLSAGINGQSLFTDEGYSAWLASHKSIASMWRSLYEGDTSEMQMLLYNIYLWVWAHIFGSSEHTLRLGNLTFAALTIAALAFTSRQAFGRPLAWLPVAMSPFLLFFLNEARAYSAVIACATASAGALLVYIHNERGRRITAALCPAFLVAGLWFHIMTVVLIPALIVIVYIEAPKDWTRWWHDWRPGLAVAVPLLTVTGAYFIWTLLPAPKYEHGRAHLLEPVYTLYKFAGLWSLGPSNSALSGGREWNQLARHGALLGVGVMGLAIAIWGPLSNAARLLVTAFTTAFVLFCATSFATGTGLSARHASALFPLVLFFVVVQTRRTWRAVCVGGIWAFASWRMAVLPEYAKDDYRNAVQSAMSLARANESEIVWAADPITASYYGLRLRNPLHLSPYTIDYSTAIERVRWPVLAHGIIGIGATRSQAEALLECNGARDRPVVVAIPTRLPFGGIGAWRRVLASTGDQPAWTEIIGATEPAATCQLLSVYVLNRVPR